MAKWRTGLVALVAAACVLVAGYGSSSAHVTKTATVSTRTIGKLGPVLVNGKGLTLYIFVPDKQKKVTCKSTCAIIWPPLKVKNGAKPTAGGSAKAKLLGLNGAVVTYNRWPLYTYIKDHKPGQATGQGIKNSGGLWYVLSPSGKVIKTKK
jgi:predicted lipoprotein with Yx(FWY)xxD motif